MKPLFAMLAASLLIMISIGCGSTPAPLAQTSVSETRLPDRSSIAPIELLVAGFTHVRSDGNRYATGQADLPNTIPDMLSIGGLPSWVVGIPYQDGVLWAFVFDDGSVSGRMSQLGQPTEAVPITRQGDGSGPPVLYLQDGEPWLVQSPKKSWQLSPPAFAGQPTTEVSTNFGVLIPGALEASGIDLEIPSDALLLTDEIGRLLMLTGATDRYPHSVVGDASRRPVSPC